MKRRRLITVTCAILAVLIIIYKLLEYILEINNLAFMNSIVYVFSGICCVLIFSIIIQAIIGIIHIVKNKILKVLIGAMSSILILGLFSIAYVTFAFAYTPEHIVEKDDKKMVAYVSSFLQVRVNYYNYINQLVRGNKLKIYEDYGKGGYDPFEREATPSSDKFIYYDDNGKVIKSN